MTYELRIYTANPGKIDALCARFRNHTVALFAKHNMESIGYWLEDAHSDVLTYVIKHSGDPAKNWEAFIADSAWIAAKEASEIEGALVESIDARNMTPTDFSGLK